MSVNNKLLMILGPVQMEQYIIDAGACQVPYPRTTEYSEWYREINENLQYLFQTKCPVFTVTCSGTGVMQMAVNNLCSPKDTVLTFRTGTFGKRWGEIARTSGANVIETQLELGNNVTPKILNPLLKKYPESTAVFLTYNETSTTALADVQGCAKLLHNTGKLLVVDAVSALLAEPLQMDDWGIDVVISSSQKALALPPGLGFISFSEKAWKHVLARNCPSYYFDARPFLKEWERGQVPFTSSLSVVLQLRERLRYIRKEGLSTIREQYAERTKNLRLGLQHLGFIFLSDNMGNCTTAVCTPNNLDATELVSLMATKYGIIFGAPYPGSNTFRIGNFGAISNEDINYCLEKLSEAIKCLSEHQEK
jgi:Serine-pyruvate aminotransferase/archaeal aspartate aminotransferase